MSEEGTITERIAAVMVAVGTIERDAKNTFANYSYSSADAVYDAVRRLLGEHGLVVRQTSLPLQVQQVGDKAHMYLPVSTFFEGEDPQPPVPIPVARFDAQAIQAAFTYAQKYWLRGVLCLSTGEPDADCKRDGRAGRRRKRDGRAGAR